MKIYGKNKIGSLLLIISVILIWGIILFKIGSYFFDDNEIAIDVSDKSAISSKQIPTYKSSIKEKDIKYVRLDKDPFTFSRIVKPKRKITKKQRAKQQAKEQIVKEERINYSIKGVIIASESKMVIFNDKSNSETLFLREGEKYKYIKIIEITSKNVLLTEYNKPKTVNIR